MAGARPKSAVVIAATAASRPSRRTSILRRQYGNIGRTRAIETFRASHEHATARTQATSASSRLSINSCRTIRQRVAPSAKRIAISRDRYARTRQQEIRQIGGRDEQDEDGGEQRE